MKTLKYDGIEEVIYNFKCDNGLYVYLCTNNLSKNFFISLGVRYGASTTEYKKNDKKYKVTPGIAHFIEHRVLDFTKDKEAEEKVRNLGSFPNAMTNYMTTRYLMFGSLDINENMKVLFDRVFSPNFKASDIDKEKGIILEEYYMYQDDPGSAIFETLSEAMYNNYYMKTSVLGKQNDIKSISKEEIERIYNDFYVPENMYLVITGAFNATEVEDFVTKYMKKIKKKDFVAKTIYKKEKLNVCVNYQEKQMEVSEEKVALGFKCDIKEFNKMHPTKTGYYISIILNSLFSPTSSLFERYKESKLISTSFGTSRNIEDDFFDIKIIVDTENPNEFIDNIKKDLSDFEISKSDFERKKKMILSEVILNFENIQSANDFISYHVNKFKDPILEFHSIIKELNYEECLKIKKLINIDNLTIVKVIKQ